MKYIGTNIGGGIPKCLITAKKLNVDTIQMMPTAPMRWSAKEIPDEIVEAFVQNLLDNPVKKLLMHGIYLINLARGDKQLFHLSKLSLVTYLNFQSRVEDRISSLSSNDKARIEKEFEILGTCFHPGSAKDLSAEESLERVIYGINWILDNAPRGTLLIESTAGAGDVMGDTFEELAKMRDNANQKTRVGFVIDTQHTYASGYDWVNDLDGVVEVMDKTIGIENVKAIHLNDSIPTLASHKDRHANIGDGNIGLDAIQKIVSHKKLTNIPFFLETPAIKDDEGIHAELAKLSPLK